MNAEEKFDAVAPLAIYHLADCCFGLRARRGLRKLQADGRLLGCKLDEWRPEIKELYDDTFQELVEEVLKGASFAHDRWGAKTVTDAAGRQVFAGDAHGQFPWYEKSADLRARLLEHRLEVST